MPQLPFKQSLMANENGELTLDSAYSLPFNATLRQLTLRISSNCRSRLHSSSFQVFKESELVLDLQNEQVIDCVSYTLPKKDFALDKDEYKAIIISPGFDPGEKVTIEGVLRFSFGINIAELEGFEERLQA